MTRQLFLHIGASKTGTSSFQAGVVASQEALAAAGVGVPFVRRGEKVQGVLRPLGWDALGRYSRPVNGRTLDAAVRRIVRTPGDRLLLSLEDLCELGVDRIGELVGRIHATTDLEVSVVVTARDWSRQLPSEYQQQLKRRMTKTYDVYLGEVRDREGADAEQFYLRQDFAQICARWSAHVPAERLHLIPVSAADHDGIFREFAAVVGYPREALAAPARTVNQSFGLVECEVLRRLNLSLGDRMTDLRRDYSPGVRRILRKGVLNRRGQIRLTLPPEHLAWVQEAGRRQVRALHDLGVDVRGESEALVAGEDNVRPIPEFDEAEVARVAIETFANFAVQAHRLNSQKQAQESEKSERAEASR